MLTVVSTVFAAPVALVVLFNDKKVFVHSSLPAIPAAQCPWLQCLDGWETDSHMPQSLVLEGLPAQGPAGEADPEAGRRVMHFSGAPLLVGCTICIGFIGFADFVAHKFDAGDAAVLTNLAEMVVRHAEKEAAVYTRQRSLLAAYDELRQTMDCISACIVMLDTSEPGWRIVYANRAWRKTTGLSSTKVVGKALDDVVMMADGTRVFCADLEDCGRRGREYVIHKARVRHNVDHQADADDRDTSHDGNGGDGHPHDRRSHPSGARSYGTARVALPSLNASRRGDVTVGDLDPTAASPGDPSGLPHQGGHDAAAAAAVIVEPPPRNFMLKFRPASMAALRAAEAQSEGGGAAAAAVDAVVLVLPGGGGGSERSTPVLGGNGTAGKQYYFMLVDSYSSAVDTEDGVEGLVLCQLLGKGGYGSVYYGMWYGEPVAVKVIDADQKAGDTDVLIEATLGQNLCHPNVVGTLHFVRRPVTAAKAPDSPPHPVTLGGTAEAAEAPGNAAALDLLHDRPSGTPAEVADAVLSNLMSGTSARGPAGGSPSRQPDGAVTPEVSSGVPSSTLARMSPAGEMAGGVVLAGRTFGSRSSRLIQSRLSVRRSLDDPATFAPLSAIPASMLLSETSRDDNGTLPLGDRACHAYHATSPTAAAVALSGTVLESGAALTQCSLDTGQWVATDDGVTRQYQTIIVMEYCDKGSLQSAVDSGWLVCGPPHRATCNIAAVVATALEVALALQLVHDRNIMHGDLSAWNVLLSSQGKLADVAGRGFVAKICDFGHARNMEIRTKVHTHTFGTLTHMPPEALTEGTVGKHTDIYSFGVLLWQMYTGVRPWAGLTHSQIIVRVGVNGETLQFEAGAPAWLQRLATECLQRDALRRPTVGAVVEALRAAQAHLDPCSSPRREA